MFWLLIALSLNFFISWANASNCGRYWSESKVIGGYIRANVIIGYIMAIAGFTMVYGYILLLILPYVIPLIPQLEFIDVEQLIQLSGDLLYVLLVIAIVPTGFFIWFQSIITFWKNKNFRNGATAAWNTYAQARNVINASRELPSAVGRIAETLFGGDSKGSRKKKGDATLILIAIFVIIMAIMAGYFTASAIMKRADKKYDAFAFIEK